MQVNIRGTEFAVVDDHYRDYWSRVSAGEWEPGTLLAMRSVLRPGWKFYDIGSWMGPTALYAAALGAEVYSFEPDPVAYARLMANVALNSNLQSRLHCLNAACGTEEGTLTLYSDALGNSQSSMFKAWGRRTGTIVAENSVDARMIDFKAFYRSHADGRPQLLKIDIEGGEFSLVPDIADIILQNPRTVVHLSTHSANLIAADPVDEAILRINGKRSVIEPFLHLNCYVATKDGLEKQDSAEWFRRRLGVAAYPDEVLFSTFEI